jgi:hypothetical protein
LPPESTNERSGASGVDLVAALLEPLDLLEPAAAGARERPPRHREIGTEVEQVVLDSPQPLNRALPACPPASARRQGCAPSSSTCRRPRSADRSWHAAHVAEVRLAAVAELGVDARQVDGHRVAVSVAERYDGAVIGRWHGKPVRIRRGPATVTGEVHRTRASASHWLATASREGAERIGPEARRPAPTASPHRPSWKGVGHSCNAPNRAVRRCTPRRHTCSHSYCARGRRHHAVDGAAAADRPGSPLPSPSASRAQARRSSGDAVSLSSTPVIQERRRADSCAGASALGALQAATTATGTAPGPRPTRSYFLTGIEGPHLSRHGATYWAFWVNDKPSAVGHLQLRSKARIDSLPVLPRLLRQELSTERRRARR